MLKRFYGFFVDTNNEFVIKNISKYGIKKGFKYELFANLNLEYIYYYVDVEMNIIEDSDIRYLVEYVKVSDELKTHLKNIRQQYISLCKEDKHVSELQFFDDIGEIDAPTIENENVEFDCETDDEYNNTFSNHENHYRYEN